jgi:hypothetical protein
MLLFSNPLVTLRSHGLPGFLCFVFPRHSPAPLADAFLPSLSNSSLPALKDPLPPPLEARIPGHWLMELHRSVDRLAAECYHCTGCIDPGKVANLRDSVVVSTSGGEYAAPVLEAWVPPEALALASADEQKSIPALAKDPRMMSAVEQAARQLPTRHELFLGDGREMDVVPDESVHLVVTSPPYWTLKQYPAREAQLGLIEDYELFLSELDKVWHQVYRVLTPGGRLVVVVGDVCLSRRSFGRHVVFPLHASIQEHCRRLGFDNLAPYFAVHGF